ncbi:hypothetical protein KsCSTR_36530 [Candidatus Kuenenia stuttgartiensis]|uniref:Uncharacterized protein n=1 Tax=Kuenenia stuttgartiensis TaxID=174633 RepID=A0A6G7GUK4_KUEST|nr:hypothetical protein KsCSTR_36530 [Candidatus Kuenenia stuttgartiensis]
MNVFNGMSPYLFSGYRLENKTTKNSLSTDTTTRYGYKPIFIVSGCCK